MSQALVLDQKLRSQVQSERKITHAILLTIQELDITQSYRELGYSSIYTYLVAGIGYSEGAAHRRISSARLLKSCPEVASQIQAGQINLTQLAAVQTAIKQEEKKTKTKLSKSQKDQALQSLEGKNTFETQKALLESFPSYEISKPKVLPAKDKKIHIQLEFTEADWEKVQNLLAHMSHKVPDQKLESALLYWADQIEKRTSKVPKENVKSPEPPPLRRSNQGRKYISVSTKTQVITAAQRQCEYVSPLTGLRCQSRHYLDIDHRTPLALGGNNAIENLRVLCRSHNHLMPKQMHLLSPPETCGGRERNKYLS